MEEGEEGQNTIMEVGRNGFSEAKKGHLIRIGLYPLKYCRKLREGMSVKSYWIWHRRVSWSRGGSQIVGKYDLERVTEGFD